MLSFKEYSQLNESPDVLAHAVNHLVNHPITKDFKRKSEGNLRGGEI